MPPKGAFTIERVQQFGVAAVERARAAIAKDGGPSCGHLSCNYRGVVKDDGACDINERATFRGTIAYEWRVCACGYDEKALVSVRCGNASDRGVPFPDGWQTAVRCSNLQTVAEDAAKAARDEIGGEIACKLLGVAMRTAIPEPCEHLPGATVLLAGDGSRMAHLLCARITGDTWLCHRGSFQDGKLNESDPLNEHDMVGL
jgi:hypothetical protein